MTRRLALAVALAFTTVVTFAMVAIGAQAGFFGGGGNDGAPAEASAGQTPTAEPTVVTEYIYIDQTATPGPSGAPSQDSSGDAADNPGQVSESGSGDGAEIGEQAPSPPSSGDDEHHESEHEEDDD